jgi:hypothetical protein
MSIVQRRARALAAPLLAAVLVVGAGVLAAPLAACTGDDPVVDSSSSGGAGADASAGAEGGSDAAGMATSGDVIFLAGDAIVAGVDGNITSWPSSVSGVVARPASAAPPTRIVLPGGQVCAAFSGAVDPLVIGASDAIATPADFSVTVVLKRGAKLDQSKFFGRVAIGRVSFADRVYSGFALMSEHQDAQGFITSSRYAARLSVNYDTSFAVEAVEPSVRDDGLHVVVLQRAGDNVQLRIDSERFGPSVGASAVVVPSSQPIAIGGLLGAMSDVGIFTGAICTVIVHAGTEADAAITSRIAALRSQYGI